MKNEFNWSKGYVATSEHDGYISSVSGRIELPTLKALFKAAGMFCIGKTDLAKDLIQPRLTMHVEGETLSGVVSGRPLLHLFIFE